jgi:hypothetical protein
METRRGIAKKVRFSTEVSVSSDKNGSTVSTTHMVIFNLDGAIVHASATRPPTVEEGDEVVVAGTMHDGVFSAPALRNITRGTVDHQAWVGGLLVGAIFLVVGGGVAILFLASKSDQGAALFPLVFAALGGWFVRSYSRIRAAEARVRAAR